MRFDSSPQNGQAWQADRQDSRCLGNTLTATAQAPGKGPVSGMVSRAVTGAPENGAEGRLVPYALRNDATLSGLRRRDPKEFSDGNPSSHGRCQSGRGGNPSLVRRHRPATDVDRGASLAGWPRFLCADEIDRHQAASPSLGYRSGRNSWRETPVARSTSRTLSAGTRTHCETAWLVILRAAARAAGPFTASIASISAGSRCMRGM